MRHEIIMPALGMAQDTGTLLAWHKAEGEAVTQGETLFEVETDKTTMDVEAPASGYLVGVTASNGEEVPVGKVIALITDTAENPEPAQPKEPATGAIKPDSVPDGEPIIMPVLGMSQDSGLLVGWKKQPGDAVSADDILFEVETDKSISEVPAGKDGFLAARLAAAGDDVPTGETIAIISSERPAQTVDRSYSGSEPAPAVTEAPKTSAPPKAEPKASAAKTDAAKKAKPTFVPKPGWEGPVLASPKLRRLAHQAGLDLALLAATGQPQPFHARDFDALKEANESADTIASAGLMSGAESVNRLTAHVSAAGFESFLEWAADNNVDCDETSILASFAGLSLSPESTVQIDTREHSRTFATRQQLTATIESEGVPDLVVHDLRRTFISTAELSPMSVPVIAVTATNDELTLTLVCAESKLGGSDAARLLDNLAGRLADPIRHLF